MFIYFGKRARNDLNVDVERKKHLTIDRTNCDGCLDLFLFFIFVKKKVSIMVLKNQHYIPTSLLEVSFSCFLLNNFNTSSVNIFFFFKFIFWYLLIFTPHKLKFVLESRINILTTCNSNHHQMSIIFRKIEHCMNSPRYNVCALLFSLACAAFFFYRNNKRFLKNRSNSRRKRKKNTWSRAQSRWMLTIADVRIFIWNTKYIIIQWSLWWKCKYCNIQNW